MQETCHPWFPSAECSVQVLPPSALVYTEPIHVVLTTLVPSEDIAKLLAPVPVLNTWLLRDQENVVGSSLQLTKWDKFVSAWDKEVRTVLLGIKTYDTYIVVKELLCAEALLDPIALIAITVQVYVVSWTKPVKPSLPVVVV